MWILVDWLFVLLHILSCQIKIKGGSGGGLSRGLHMGLDTSRRMLHVGMHYEESKKSEEDGKRRR